MVPNHARLFSSVNGSIACSWNSCTASPMNLIAIANRKAEVMMNSGRSGILCDQIDEIEQHRKSYGRDTQACKQADAPAAFGGSARKTGCLSGLTKLESLKSTGLTDRQWPVLRQLVRLPSRCQALGLQDSKRQDRDRHRLMRQRKIDRHLIEQRQNAQCRL